MKRSEDQTWDVWEEDVRMKTDFSKIIRKVRSYWPLSILCAGILVIGALLYLYKTNPVYNVSASVLIQDNDNKGNTAGGFITSLQDLGLLRASDNVYNEQMIIISYPLVEDVVRDLQLYLHFTTRENIRNISLYNGDMPFKADVVNFNSSIFNDENRDGIQYRIDWSRDGHFSIASESGSRKGTWGLPLQLPFGTLTLQTNERTFLWPSEKPIVLTVRPVTEVADRIIAHLEASIPNKQTNIINLSLQTSTPHLGVDLLNALIAAYQNSTVNDNNKLNESTLRFINQRLLIVGNELDSIETGIKHFKQKNQLANLPKQSDVLVENLSQQDRQLNSQMVQLSMINSLIEFLEENRENPRVIPASLILNDPALSSTIENYNRLLSTRERLDLSATHENPIVQNVEEQLQGLQKNIRSGLETIRNTLLVAIDKVKQQNALLTGMMREVPAIEKEFGNFSRQQTIKRDLYLFLLQKREESLLAKSSTLANSRVIGPARASKDPIKPKRELILLSAVLIGILLPFGYDRAATLLNTRVRTKEDVSNITRVPVIGEIGFNKVENGEIVSNQTRNLMAEQFRALRTNLQFLITAKSSKVILITSVASGEGKTFISSNLSGIFGLTDKKIVLLEMDLRRPRIMQSLGMKAHDGFAQYAMGKAGIADIIIPSTISENVSVIPAGAIPFNPAELILHPRTDELFHYLRNHFDIIIIDSAPSIVSEPQLLSKYADVTLYVVRINHTEKEQLKQINNPNIADKLPGLHLVINGIKPRHYGPGYYTANYYEYTSSQPERRSLNPIK